MLRILADDPDNTLALNDFALIANRLYGSSYFHNLLLSSFSAISRRTSGSSCTPTHYATMPKYSLVVNAQNKNSFYEFSTAFELYHTTMPIANVFCNLSGCFFICLSR